jgi:hypothetical protein
MASQAGSSRAPDHTFLEKCHDYQTQSRSFQRGMPACQIAIEFVNRLACGSCEVSILDMNDINVAKRARDLSVRSVPAVVINGQA